MEDNLILILQGSQMQVDMARVLLEENDIRSLVRSEHGMGFVLRAGGMFEEYYLYVAPEDAEEAAALCEAFCQ